MVTFLYSRTDQQLPNPMCVLNILWCINSLRFCRTRSLSSWVSRILFCSRMSFSSYCSFSISSLRWLFSSSSISFCLISISQVRSARSAWKLAANWRGKSQTECKELIEETIMFSFRITIVSILMMDVPGKVPVYRAKLLTWMNGMEKGEELSVCL